MRALIRAEIAEGGKKIPDREKNRAEYDDAVIRLVKLLGYDTVLAISSIVLSLVLFWWTPDWAPHLTHFLEPAKKFDELYVQGLIERIYSALLVTFFITFLDLTVYYRHLRRNRPILWNAGIEPTKATES